jgi:hypothetical protein
MRNGARRRETYFHQAALEKARGGTARQGAPCGRFAVPLTLTSSMIEDCRVIVPPKLSDATRIGTMGYSRTLTEKWHHAVELKASLSGPDGPKVTSLLCEREPIKHQRRLLVTKRTLILVSTFWRQEGEKFGQTCCEQSSLTGVLALSTFVNGVGAGSTASAETAKPGNSVRLLGVRIWQWPKEI